MMAGKFIFLFSLVVCEEVAGIAWSHWPISALFFFPFLPLGVFFFFYSMLGSQIKLHSFHVFISSLDLVLNKLCYLLCLFGAVLRFHRFLAPLDLRFMECKAELHRQRLPRISHSHRRVLWVSEVSAWEQISVPTEAWWIPAARISFLFWISSFRRGCALPLAVAQNRHSWPR